MAAGLLDDGRQMIPRLNDLMLTIVKDAKEHVLTSDNGTLSDANAPIEAEIVDEK
jgi:hypothetical protein